MARHEILNYLHQQEPDAIVGLTLFIEIQQCFSDWCYDLAEELEIEEDNWNPEITEIYADYFEAPSIQSAKAKLTKIANETELLFSWVQSWDNETREYTGKDLRWKPWTSPPIVTYKQDNGVEVAYSTRMSEQRISGETVYPEGYKYGKSVEYRGRHRRALETQGGKVKNPCCVRGCEDTRTHEHHIPTGYGAFGKKLTYIVRICESCQKKLAGESIQCNYFQCGGLAFVNEIWEDESDGKTQ